LFAVRLQSLDAIIQNLETATPKEILSWAWNTFGVDTVASSSFQTQSIPLLHMISEVAPEMKVLFVDTGFHFPETLAFQEQVADIFSLNVQVVRPQIMGEDFVKIYGPLYEEDPDTCCFQNKVVPIQNEIKNANAWISGIRRDQTKNRKHSPVISQQPFLQVYKINPLVNWTYEDVNSYIDQHDLPRHPLWDKGYRSIGCAPCTAPITENDYEREGRWPGITKAECGLHEY
jgi:phosphoadenosine phosphosulfate reductase